MAYDATELDEVSQVILKARELLSDPKKWTQGQYCTEARDAFCIIGAVHEAAGAQPDAGISPVASKACERISITAKMHPANFNDNKNTTHADVLALLDRAALSKAGA